MKIFSFAAKPPNRLDSDEFARSYPNSTNAKYPVNVYFVPNPDQQFPSAPHEFRDDFKKYPTGTLLYTLVAGVDKVTGLPAECLCDGQPCADIYKATTCDVVPFAALSTTSRFIASHWGDLNLFFQHNRNIAKPRNVCAIKKGAQLPDNEEFRMAGDHSLVCHAQDSHPKGPCPQGTVKHTGCPFGRSYTGAAAKPEDHP